MNNGHHKSEITDAQLVSAALEGDQNAYTHLMERYKEPLKLYVNEYVGYLKHSEGIIELAEEPQDIVQEAFHKAFQALPSYNPNYKFSTWLYRIARNTAFDYLNKQDREKNNMPTTSIHEDFAELKELPATMHNPEEDIINQQEYDKWLTNIEKLKDDYKLVARMNLIDNFGYKEIADELGMPLNTVKTKIRRAKALLLKMMNYSDEAL